MAARKKPGKIATAAVLGIVLGVPLTAAGITFSQIGLGFTVETISAWITAAAGLLIAGLYFQLALNRACKSAVRICWMVTAVSLAIGMVLAAMYGSRQIIPLEWLTIPWMRTLHGTANSFGFALAGLVGWKLVNSQDLKK